jgi:hypothetical protein
MLSVLFLVSNVSACLYCVYNIKTCTGSTQCPVLQL